MNTSTSSFPDIFKSYSVLYYSLNLKAGWIPVHFTDTNAQSLQVHCTYSTVCSLFYWTSNCFQIALSNSLFSFFSVFLNYHRVNESPYFGCLKDGLALHEGLPCCIAADKWASPEGSSDF